MSEQTGRSVSDSVWETIFRTSLDGFCELDANGRFVDVNDVYSRICGYSREQLLAMRVEEIDATHTPRDGAALLENLRREGFMRFESVHRHRHGHLVPVEVTTRFVPELGGRYFCTIRDISERVRAEETLRLRTRELKEAQRLAQIGNSLRDLRTDVIVWSDELYRIFGMDPGTPPPSLEGFEQLIAESSLDTFRAARKALVEEHKGFELELELRHVGDRPKWITYRAEVECDAAGRPASLRGTIQDITERWLATRALRESEWKYRTIVEATSEGIGILDPEGDFVFANKQGAAMLGYTGPDGEKEIVGVGLTEFMNEKDRSNIKARMATRVHGVNEQYDAVFRTRDGRDIRLLVHASPFFDERGQFAGTLGIISDITQRALLEDRLRQSHKMEAIGRLAGGVAHDFNNLLLVINGYCDLLLNRVPPSDPTHARLSAIRKAGQRAQVLTGRMLALSRRQVRETEVLSLSAVVADIETILRPIVGETITIVTAFESGSDHVRADRTELTQILMNLAVNARDAMPGGGMLHFATATVEIDERYAQSHPGAHAGAYVLLTVTDTGVGMDAEILQHIFEPFFTTKEGGSGTGLGLATVYSIVLQNSGWVQVESAPGSGSTFRVYLPRVVAALVSQDPQASEPPQLYGAETILVAEDQRDVRELTCQILREFGYHVLEASGGDEALRLVETHVGPLDLVLTDVVMPGMGGPELVTHLQTIRPTPFLFMSGYPGGIDLNNDPGVAYIQKPFTPNDLAAKVREVLKRRS